MASFLSALSLVILVLANSCLTLPVLNEDISTISLLNDDLTTDLALNVGWVSNDHTTVLPTLPLRRSSDEHMGFELSTIVDNLPEENTSRVPRTFEEFSTSEPSMLTTEEAMANKHDYNDTLFTTVRPSDLTTDLLAKDKRQFSVLKLSTDRSSVLTTEGFFHHKRGQDHLLFTTGEPAKLTTEESVKSQRGFSALLYDIVEPLLLTTEGAINNESSPVDSSLTTVEPSVLTTEESVKSRRGFSALLYDIVEPLLLTTDVTMNNESNSSDLSFTTVKPITQVGQIQKRNFENGTEGELVDESNTDERSTVPSKSKGKSIGHLEDSNEQVEKQERPKKPLKSQRKLRISSTTTTRDYNIESEETSKGSTIPTAEFDQDASKKISNIPSDFLILDETVEIAVTDLPKRLSNTTMEDTKEAKPLNQGQKSSDIEEKESDN